MSRQEWIDAYLLRNDSTAAHLFLWLWYVPCTVVWFICVGLLIRDML